MRHSILIIILNLSNESFGQLQQMLDRAHQLTQEKYVQGNLIFIRSLCEIAHSEKSVQDTCVTSYGHLKSEDFFRIPVNVYKGADNVAQKKSCYAKSEDNLKRFGDVSQYTSKCRNSSADAFDPLFRLGKPCRFHLGREKWPAPPPGSKSFDPLKTSNRSTRHSG